MFEILLGIACIVFASRVAPAIARRIGGQAVDTQLVKHLEDLDQKMARSEDRLMALSAGTDDRLLEIEERLDFAERLLQQQRERERLPGAE